MLVAAGPVGDTELRDGFIQHMGIFCYLQNYLHYFRYFHYREGIHTCNFQLHQACRNYYKYAKLIRTSVPPRPFCRARMVIFGSSSEMHQIMQAQLRIE
jgi:hypothetical protein